jgi:hypothetical protein
MSDPVVEDVALHRVVSIPYISVRKMDLLTLTKLLDQAYHPKVEFTEDFEGMRIQARESTIKSLAEARCLLGSILSQKP